MPLGKKYQLALSQHRSLHTPLNLGERTLQSEIKHSAMVRTFWKTSGAYAASVKLIKTHKERKQGDEGEKKNPHPLSLRQVSLPITTVIIPGIAILLKKWLPPNDRRLPICEGRYLSLTSGECWESSPRSVVAEHILGQLQSDLLWATSTNCLQTDAPAIQVSYS